ncbi:MAG: methyltransferase domain-containing protein [Okeania sp. SIO3B5]|uniref:SAM-dependent methyltransferase n=1 Tax=Okeania sp. SIO3B5 TaxID=2607811 RepID=UPI00140160A7|nr:class I SAM-dependent methyltransferase [Okeania sp. SIO3B5]NEO54655.1 methyltransferase domain-containing protein [Okeania sp. SIO3B5]
MEYSKTIAKTRDYYNSDNMMNFHSFIYGENIHIGLYTNENESIAEANFKALEMITSLLNLSPSTVVLDLGSGYGGTARYLTQKIGCRVDCLNLSETQNELNRELNRKLGLESLIQVIDGSFEAIPTPSNIYDVVWSQDALLYSSDRVKVFQEVSRVLKKKGEFILTDVMQSDDCPVEVGKQILETVDITSLASIKSYQKIAKDTGFEEIQITEMPEQLTNQYQKTLLVMEQNYDELAKSCDREFLEYQRVRLNNWVKTGKQGYLNWGILHFRQL